MEMKGSGKIFSIDIDKKKMRELKKRISENNINNVWPILISDLFDKKLLFLDNKVDYVLVDAPCSGLGTLRRNPDLKWKYSYEKIRKKIDLQNSILQRASSLCKVGGYLIYSTCTNIYGENEGVISNFLKTNPHFVRCNNRLTLSKQKILLDEKFELFDNEGNIQLWTDVSDTDCFFMTKLVRNI